MDNIRRTVTTLLICAAYIIGFGAPERARYPLYLMLLGVKMAVDIVEVIRVR